MKTKKEKEMILITWESWFLSCTARFEMYNMSLNCHQNEGVPCHETSQLS